MVESLTDKKCIDLVNLSIITLNILYPFCTLGSPMMKFIEICSHSHSSTFRGCKRHDGFSCLTFIYWQVKHLAMNSLYNSSYLTTRNSSSNLDISFHSQNESCKVHIEPMIISSSSIPLGQQEFIILLLIKFKIFFVA